MEDVRDFVREDEGECPVRSTRELTGWEVVIFDLDDDAPEGEE